MTAIVSTVATGAQLAAAFSPSVLKALARSSLGPASARLARVAEYAPSQFATLGDAFTAAHHALARSYRSEYLFKNQIISKVVFGRHSPRTASAIVEMPMGASIADVVIVNGTMTTYEIKTDLDQFARLETQLGDYARYTEHVNVVVSDRRAALAEKQIAEGVGIVALRRNGALTTIRTSSSNVETMSAGNLFLLLRTAEAAMVLNQCIGYVADVPSGHLWSRMRGLFGELTVEMVHDSVLAQLRARGASASELVSAPDFPTSMRALAYSAELSGIGVRRVRARLGAPASEFLSS